MIVGVAMLAVSNAWKLAEFTETARFETLQRAEMEQLRLRDGVTGLGNAVALRRELAAHMAAASPVALVLIEFDRPDLVASRIGVHRMDALVAVAARRLRGALAPGAALYRHRDAAFAVVSEVEDRADALRLADDTGIIFDAPFEEIARTAFASATVAVAVAPQDGADAATLIAAADEGLIAARRRREAEQLGADVDPERATRLAADLPHALQAGEFVLHYQPCIRALDGAMIGVEALVRWRHPEFGLLLPAAFIEIAERESLIVPLGEWVMRESACMAARLSQHGDINVAFNVSARQFRDVAFSERLRDAIARSGASPAALTMELTESTAMDRTAQTHVTLDACALIGIGIALDDFGTGYSSLAYLKHFPIDTVKIDRTFVAGLPHDESDVAIARAIIALGRAIDCIVHAEGVETPEQAAWLRDAGCDRLQGFHIAHPMPGDALEARLVRAQMEIERASGT